MFAQSSILVLHAVHACTRRDVHDVHVYKLLIIGLLAIFLAWMAWEAIRSAWLIWKTPTSTANTAAEGYMEFSGRGELIYDTPYHAPLTGTPCLWYDYTIEKQKNRAPPTEESDMEWVRLDAGSSGPFRLVCETGELVVDPAGADVTASQRDCWLGEWGFPQTPRPRNAPGGGGPYRLTEHRIAVGESLYALGQLSYFSAPPADAETDGRGVAGWLARKRLSSCKLLGRTDEHDGRPFLIASGSQSRVLRHYAWRGIFLLLCTLAIAGLAAVFAQEIIHDWLR